MVLLVPEPLFAAGEEDDEEVPSLLQFKSSDVHGDWDDDDEDDDEEESEDAEQEEQEDEESDVLVHLGWNESNDADPAFELLVGGYLRVGYTSIQNPSSSNTSGRSTIGRHDGFILHDARLELDGQLQNGLGFVFEMDGAVSRQSGSVDEPVVPLRLRLKDAMIYYSPFEWLHAQIGQFKPSFDVEEEVSTSDQLFVHRSVGSRGVQGAAGFNVDGLSVGRQLGVKLHAGPYFPTSQNNSPTGPGGSLQVSATNGQEANLSLNDNEKLAYAGRAALHWGKFARIGGALYFNDRTIGTRPNRVNSQIHSWTADVTAEYEGFTLMGSIIRRTEQNFSTEHTAQSIQVQAAYREPYLGVQPAYRFALYDPSVTFEGSEPSPDSPFAVDRLQYHTIGLNYRAKNYPLVVMANYTITQEQDPVSIKNNRFDALVQLSW